MRLVVAETYFKPRPHSKELPFFKDVLNWFDFLAIIPFYVETVASLFAGISNLQEAAGDEWGPFLQIVRMCRIFRIFKVVRHFETSAILSQAARESWKPLLVPLLFLLIFVMLFGAIIFFVEPCYNPEDCVFTDIFNAAYFVTVTMTTARHDSAEDFCRSNSRRCTAMDWIFILAYCFAIP